MQFMVTHYDKESTNYDGHFTEDNYDQQEHESEHESDFSSDSDGEDTTDRHLELTLVTVCDLARASGSQLVRADDVLAASGLRERQLCAALARWADLGIIDISKGDEFLELRMPADEP